MTAPRALVVSPIFPFPPVSGGRKRALRLLDAMQASGLRPHVLSIVLTDAGREEAERQGWAVEQFDEPDYDIPVRLRQHLGRQMLAPSLRLVRRIAELGPSSALIQLEEIDALVYLPAAARAAPTIASLHNVDSVARRPDLSAASARERLRSEYHLHRMRVAEARAARAARAIACVSVDDRRHFDAIGARQTILAPNGVDASLFELPAAPDGDRSVLFFGQIAWAPNLEGLDRFLREAWPQVHRALPDARLRVAGWGVEHALATRGPVEDGVDVLGLVDDIARELARATVVVVPIWSGGGTRLKVLEAMAAARTLVSTPLGVAGIGFEDRRHGLLAESPAGLAEQLIAVLDDPVQGRRLGLAAREHARGFEWSLATAELRGLYSAFASARDGEARHPAGR